jgi:hypothetical protein
MTNNTDNIIEYKSNNIIEISNNSDNITNETLKSNTINSNSK